MNQRICRDTRTTENREHGKKHTGKTCHSRRNSKQCKNKCPHNIPFTPLHRNRTK